MELTFSGKTVVSIQPTHDRVLLVLNDEEEGRKLTIGFKPDDAANIGSILMEAAHIVVLRLNAGQVTTSPIGEVSEKQVGGGLILPPNNRPS